MPEPPSGHEPELEHLLEPIDASEELPGRVDADRPIALVPFFFVVVVVEGLDLLLGTRLRFADVLGSTGAQASDAIERGADVVFAVFAIVALSTVVASRRTTRRFALGAMTAYLAVATINVVSDVVTLVGTAHLQQAGELSLLWDVGVVYVSTTLVFSLWYQLADSYLPGGAIDFPPNAAHPDEPPKWFDYLFLSFNTNATFGPTVETVKTRPTKALMMLQSTVSLIVLIVLIARVVGLTS